MYITADTALLVGPGGSPASAVRGWSGEKGRQATSHGERRHALPPVRALFAMLFCAFVLSEFVEHDSASDNRRLPLLHSGIRALHCLANNKEKKRNCTFITHPKMEWLG